MLFQILIASTIGGVLSLIGGILLLWKESFAKRISFYLVSFAAGSLLGAAFFDLLPEALEGGGEKVLPYALAGVLLVLLFEKTLGWYHHHDQEYHQGYTFSAQSVLFGDALHNFVDGITIALGFFISLPVGIATTFAVFVHEIPQEIGDFGILIQRGYPRIKIITYNLLTALATLVGAVFAYYLAPFLPAEFIYFGLALAAGTFIYISTADLIPEMREHTAGGFGFFHVLTIFAGVITVVVLSGIIPE
jgi:zinc and cadmium transporter